MSAQPRQPRTIPALTGIRALAAGAVVAWHLRDVAYALLPATALAKPLLDGGILGVDVFFVLSGYVIAHTYAERLARLDGPRLRAYLGARLARIYPVHLVTLLLAAGMVAYGGASSVGTTGEVSPATFVGNLLMLQAFPGVPAWNVPAWSVSCELAAYVLFPLVAARLLRLRRVTAVTLTAVVLLAQTIGLFAVTTSPHAVTAYEWLRIAGEFSAGALLWAATRRAGPARLWDGAAALVVVAAGVLLATGYPFVLVAPVLALLVPAVALSAGPVRAVLSHAAIQWGGRVSYSLYLVHGPVILTGILWIVPPAQYVAAPLGQRLAVLVGLAAVSLGAAAALYRWVEEPARHRLRRGSRPSPEHAPTEPLTTIGAATAATVRLPTPGGGARRAVE